MKIKCPKCNPAKPLQAESLKKSLIAYRCGECCGKYLPSRNYLAWRESQRESLPERDALNDALRSNDSIGALICPECSRIMLKYVVGHGIQFKVDFCRSCNGVWLDENEWEILESKNLHDEINLFFTESWQSKVRRAEVEEHIETLFEERVGLENYRKVADFKTWVASSPFKAEILAYLQDSQPK